MPRILRFDPQNEIPSLAGKVILVTGGTAGLGRETALSFAGHGPAHIYFTRRSQSSVDRLVEDVQSNHSGTPVTFLKCDLASLASVQAAAIDLLSRTDRLDIVMLNAGVMGIPAGLTQDGYEIQFGTNHLGHALLVKLITPLLERTPAHGSDVRLVMNTSLGYKGHTRAGIHFDTIKTDQRNITPVLSTWMRYGQSKLANLLYARAYARHHPSITSVSIHPGVSATGLVTSLSFSQRMFVYGTNIGNMISAEECAWNQRWAATAPKGDGERQVESGKYFEPVGIKMVPSGKGNDDVLAEKLWEWTQKELEGYAV